MGTAHPLVVLHDTGAVSWTVGFVDPRTPPRAVSVAVLATGFDPGAATLWRSLSARCDVLCGLVASEAFDVLALAGSWSLRAHPTLRPERSGRLGRPGVTEVLLVAARSRLGPRFDVDVGALELRLPAAALVLSVRVDAAMHLAVRPAVRPLFAPEPGPVAELAAPGVDAAAASPVRRVVFAPGAGVCVSRRSDAGVVVLDVSAPPAAIHGFAASSAHVSPLRRGVCVSF